MFLSLIESKQIGRDKIDVAKTEQEAIKLVEQSFVKAGKVALEDQENQPALVGNDNLYALILLKDEIDTNSNEFKVASQIKKLNAKYLRSNDLYPLMVYCLSHSKDEQM